MKKILVLVALGSLLSCQNNSEPEVQSQTEITETTVKIEQKSVEFKKVYFEFLKLYNELLEFKSNDNFVKFGFAKGGNYNEWLKNVETLKDDPDANLLLDNNLIVGDLLNLGFAYVGSKGKETKVTKDLDDWISNNLLEE